MNEDDEYVIEEDVIIYDIDKTNDKIIEEDNVNEDDIDKR